MIGSFEEILLNDRYAEFIELAFSVSDNYESGLVNDLASFETLCNNIAEEIAGQKIETMINMIADKDMPRVLRMALNGLYYRVR